MRRLLSTAHHPKKHTHELATSTNILLPEFLAMVVLSYVACVLRCTVVTPIAHATPWSIALFSPFFSSYYLLHLAYLGHFPLSLYSPPTFF